MKLTFTLTFFLITVTLFSQQDDIYAKKGIKLGKKGKYEKALVNFDKALDINPNNVNALYYKGYIYEQMENYDEAIKFYSKAIKADVEDFMYYRRGKCYFNNELDSLAILDFNEALKRIPDNPEILMSRASAYLRTEQYDKLLVDLNTRLKQNPNDYFTKANKSIALKKLGKYEEALKVLFELENEMPKEHLHRVYNGIADTYMELNSLNEAKVYIEKSLSLVSDYDVAYLTKAEILLKLGDKETACKEFNRAIELGYDINELDEAKKLEFNSNCKN
jgi:tetratricopeptide (TPR) repeat protein